MTKKLIIDSSAEWRIFILRQARQVSPSEADIEAGLRTYVIKVEYPDTTCSLRFSLSLKAKQKSY
jgi:hypothetical protein